MKYYIAIMDPDTQDDDVLRGDLLSLRGYAHLRDVAEALAWQKRGGFDLTYYHIVTPDPDLPGVMVCRATGKPVLIDRGCFTTEAFARFLRETWDTTRLRQGNIEDMYGVPVCDNVSQDTDNLTNGENQ